MLTLQRASAGSGKTYTLTKKYIRLLISIKDEGAEAARLRNDAELRDSTQHILAVTFTNKATDEMKTRIMSKLNDLAYNVEPDNLKATDYLLDFMKEFNVGHKEISHACEIVLRNLLYSFSDFSVMTIDSFFQAILRTFAYEVELPDGYELVIDSTSVNKEVVYNLIEDMRSNTLDPAISTLIRKLIKEAAKSGAKGWNIFNQDNWPEKSGTPFERRKPLTQLFCDIANEFDKEVNKEPREKLKEYFRNGGNLRDAIKEGDRIFDTELEILFGKVVDAARNELDELENIAINTGMKAEEFVADGKKTISALNKYIAADAKPEDDIKSAALEADRTSDNVFSSKFNKKTPESLIGYKDALADIMNATAQAIRNWRAYKLNPDYIAWKIFREMLPFVSLMYDIQERTEKFLVETGMMKLSDTNTILNKVISDEDVPFIYERFGTRFNHFLIDEFQDTSLKQWENFRPLLNESVSKDNENLIIGDAKQSIYRFRSADPTLISERVPSEFASRIDIRGYSEEENANYRSMGRIVKFNNYFFRLLTNKLGGGLEDLYANTVQLPKKADDCGFVKVEFYPVASKTNSDEEDSKLTDSLLDKLYDTIRDLLGRGYRQNEIAILTNTNAAAGIIIPYLSDKSRRDSYSGMPHLAFVGEDSLKLGNSRAVGVVIQCLQMIQNGLEGIMSDANSGNGRINWNDISAHFRYYAIMQSPLQDSAPEKDMLQDNLEEFLSGAFDGSGIADMLAEMQAVTLPSLVEAIIEKFVSRQMREGEAIYLAAFQDQVLSYCDVFPADIASFLRWWKKGGKNVSVISPEGSEAISVMTIHKSKGLEFPCVLLPQFDFKLSMGDEIVWVNVPENFPIAAQLPEMLPIRLQDTKKSAEMWQESPFADIKNNYVRQARADILNKAYVAMTRAIYELYIFLPADEAELKDTKDNPVDDPAADENKKIKGKSKKSDSNNINNLAKAFKEIIGKEESPEGERGEEADKMPANGDIQINKESYIYGEPIADVAGTLKNYRENKVSEIETEQINDYFVNSDRTQLKYQPEGQPKYVDLADDDRQDPRSEGSLLHAVLENVRVASDLKRAFDKIRARGWLSRDQVEVYYAELEKALRSVADRGWFDGSRKVMTERALLQRGEKMHRPDRVMINPDGSMIVIDYKFGTSKNNSHHRRQVKRYARLLGKYAGVEVNGYLWYVKEGKVEEVI